MAGGERGKGGAVADGNFRRRSRFDFLQMEFVSLSRTCQTGVSCSVSIARRRQGRRRLVPAWGSSRGAGVLASGSGVCSRPPQICVRVWSLLATSSNLAAEAARLSWS